MGALISAYPFLEDWLEGYGFAFQREQTFAQAAQAQEAGFYENNATTREGFGAALAEYLRDMLAFLGEAEEEIRAITLLPGTDKDCQPEGFDAIELRQGQVTAVIGNTGSGKSRLLADIEWGAEADTPTGRTVLYNGRTKAQAGAGRQRRVAQLSQNMNFVLDMNVGEFLRMHGECFGREEAAVRQVYEVAQELSGEPFSLSAHVTSLSGGQSRALMIADCALLSAAPVVLIDEIENAGIDRRRALNLLTGEDKIVLIATHDPVLALLADARLVIKNGGIRQVLRKSPEEELVLQEAETLDRRMIELRSLLRAGERLRK